MGGHATKLNSVTDSPVRTETRNPVLALAVPTTSDGSRRIAIESESGLVRVVVGSRLLTGRRDRRHRDAEFPLPSGYAFSVSSEVGERTQLACPGRRRAERTGVAPGVGDTAALSTAGTPRELDASRRVRH